MGYGDIVYFYFMAFGMNRKDEGRTTMPLIKPSGNMYSDSRRNQSLDFLGRPPFATSLISSTQDGSYIAVGPEYPMGLIPFLESLILAVFGLIPRISPISFTFNPFTPLLSVS
jgi:hypothetical protein